MGVLASHRLITLLLLAVTVAMLPLLFPSGYSSANGAFQLLILGAGELAQGKSAIDEEAAAIVDNDPFVRSGVFKSWVIRPWNPIFVNKALLPD